MKVLKVINQILAILAPIVYLVVGIVVIVTCVVADEQKAFNSTFLGVVLLVTNAHSFINYFTTKEYKKESNTNMAISLIGIALGFVFLFSKMQLSFLCFLWGLLEIIKGSFDVQKSFHEIKKDKKEIARLVIALAEITFGALLCIHVEEGLKEHLIFLGITFILNAIFVGAEEIINFVDNKKEKDK